MIRVDYNDIIGKQFGKLTVIKYIGPSKQSYITSHGEVKTKYQYMYLCRCSCGNENYTTSRYSLIRSDGKGNKSCGTCVQRDIIGKTFGDLTVIAFIGYKNGSDAYYKCKCKCGGETESRRSHLLSGESKSCGFCVRNSSIGKKFNHITVMSLADKNKHNQQKVMCKCDCGNVYETELYGVRKHNSCGKCFYLLPDSYKEPYHSNCVRLSRVYDGIVSRCCNPNHYRFYNYGGRGIKCEFSREEFIAKYYKLNTENLQVDRINNDGNYSFDNIRWVDNYTNSQNKTKFYDLTYSEFASRLIPKDQHINSYTVNHSSVNKDEYYVVEFEELKSFPGDNTLCLYIHSTLGSNIALYINTIKKHYLDCGRKINYSRIIRPTVEGEIVD